MTSRGSVLIIDDERNLTFVLQAMLSRAGYEVVAFNDSLEALQVIQHSAQSLDLVITDLYMPGPGGMQILEACQKVRSDVPVVMMTAFGTVEAAVNALKRGAFDFVTKPFDQDELLNVVANAVATRKRAEGEPTVRTGATAAGAAALAPTEIIGSSPGIQEIYRVISKIAASPTTVLIQGESGTGKELVAYEVHRRSDRASKPFIKINCAAIPATLIESELFGYEKGAFTGAAASKPGRFELANGGTLFLDEVGEMSLDMQVKLLRALQEQEFERVGGIQTVRVDVRIITATNKDLAGEVKAGRFREDLFYRLNVVPIRLPALRERREDIEALAGHFLKQFNVRLRKEIVGLEPAALEALKTYDWPGNIRQLENVLERMVLMAEGPVLRRSDLPSEMGSVGRDGVSAHQGLPLDPAQDAAAALGAGSSLKEIVKQQTSVLEKELIEKILESTGGNVTRAAERLGLSRKGLQIKIKDLGLKRPLDE